jgi:hypothetical protein
MHKLFQAANERCSAISAHLEKDCLNAIDKLLMRLLSSSAARGGKLHKDLSPVFAAAPSFHQSPILQAVNRANNRRRVNTQMRGDTTNSAGLSGSLSIANHPEEDELRHAEAILVSVFESHPENSA